MLRPGTGDAVHAAWAQGKEGRIVSFDNRVAWVTGGGRGIGRALALALAREGVSVATSSRTEAEINAVADET